MIAIIDYGSGNIKAVAHIYKGLNAPFFIASKPSDLLKATKFILPGVGAFDQAMGALIKSGMKEKLDELVLEKKKPILGICVGMQILANSSEEGVLPGLAWIDGVVKKFEAPQGTEELLLPQMGWNIVKPIKCHSLFQDIYELTRYYFLHSYHFVCHQDQHRLATTRYGYDFASAVCNEHIFGVQFHPEKSHQAGIQLLKNFSCFPSC